MKKLKHLLLGLPAVYGLNTIPSICAWDPPITVEAGSSVLSASINNPWAKRCEATMRFADPAYLPVTWTFDRITCVGLEVARFPVPEAVPNGDAYVLWQCAGQASLTCSHVIISNGTADPDSLVLEQVGQVGCILDSRQTTTTLVTRTMSNSLIVETISSLVTLTTTSFLSTVTADSPSSSDLTSASGSSGTPVSSTSSPSTSSTPDTDVTSTLSGADDASGTTSTTTSPTSSPASSTMSSDPAGGPSTLTVTVTPMSCL